MVTSHSRKKKAQLFVQFSTSKRNAYLEKTKNKLLLQ